MTRYIIAASQGDDPAAPAIAIEESRVEAAAPDLLAALEECLAYIEMSLAHRGPMSVEAILENLREHVQKLDSVETGHHLGCAKTTRRVNLTAARAALAKARGASPAPPEAEAKAAFDAAKKLASEESR